MGNGSPARNDPVTLSIEGALGPVLRVTIRVTTGPDTAALTKAGMTGPISSVAEMQAGDTVGAKVTRVTTAADSAVVETSAAAVMTVAVSRATGTTGVASAAPGMATILVAPASPTAKATAPAVITGGSVMTVTPAVVTEATVTPVTPAVVEAALVLSLIHI